MKTLGPASECPLRVQLSAEMKHMLLSAHLPTLQVIYHFLHLRTNTVWSQLYLAGGETFLCLAVKQHYAA